MGNPLVKFLAELGFFLAIIGGIFGYGYHVGWQGRDRQAASDVIATQIAMDKIRDQYQKMAADALAKNTVVVDRIRTKTAFLQGAVHEFVPPAADSRCVINNGFVRGLNAAIGDESAAAPAPGADVLADSGVALSAVYETGVYNAGAAKLAIAEAKSWRAWYHNLWVIAKLPDPYAPAEAPR